MIKISRISLSLVGLIVILSFLACQPQIKIETDNQAVSDPLPSWNEGHARNTIIEYVTATTDPESADFIPEQERIVVFDNDGTLWGEQPLYFQFQFVIDRIREMAPQHPEWKDEQPFKAVLENDMHTVMASGVEGLLQLAVFSSSGISSLEYKSRVKEWINTARHPETGKLFKEMVFQPMLEILDYLRVNGFQTWIVSGGGIDFMRPWTEEVYGISPQQVIGSSIKLKFEMEDGRPVIRRLPEIDFIDDKEGKPIGIEKHIGKRPVAAFGNSDGDLQMLQWAAAGEGKRLLVFIHHTDEEREWAYDRDSHIGKLDKGLDEANEKGWLVVDMKNDWKRIYPE